MTDQRSLTARYARQIALPEFGELGQRALGESHVLIVGLGGLGSVIAPYLVASGVGRLSLVDFDEVSLSNLQRQPLYGEQDIGRLKVTVASERLKAIRSEVGLTVYPHSLEELCDARRSAGASGEGQLTDPLADIDLIVDATDRLATRDLICSLSHELGVPHVYGSVNGFEGQVALLRPEDSCYRCLFPKLPRPGLIQSCAQSGVIGPAPALIGSAQALLCVRTLAHMERSAGEPLVHFDLLGLSTYRLPLTQSSACPHHGGEPQVHPQSHPPIGRSRPISAGSLQARWAEGWRPTLIDVREREELEGGMISGARSCPLSALQSWVEAGATATSDPLGLQEGPGQQDKQGQPEVAQQEIVLYCARGPRAERASELIRAHHSLKLQCWELVGGWSEWRSSSDRLG